MILPVTNASPLFPTRVEVADTDYTITQTNGLSIAYTSLTAARVVNLLNPTLSPGQYVHIADDSGQCSLTNTITVIGTIDGQANHILNYPYASITLESNGVSGHIVTAAVDHNSLANLQGGTASEYYHLTSAEYTGTGTGPFVRQTSPALLGTPTAPTAATADNSTTVATTAFVKNQGYLTSALTNPMTTAGDMIYGGTAGLPTRLPIGSTNYWLKVVAGNPTWTALASGDITGALGFTPINKAGDTGIGDLSMGALTATYQNTSNGVGTDGQSVWDINASGMGVNTRIKFANAQLGGQTLGLGYLQWLRDTAQGRTFSVFTCDSLGTSVEALKLDGPNGGAATFASSVSMAALTATTGTFSGAVSMGALTATTGTFSSTVSATTITAAAQINAASGVFTSFINAANVSAYIRLGSGTGSHADFTQDSSDGFGTTVVTNPNGVGDAAVAAFIGDASTGNQKNRIKIFNMVGGSSSLGTPSGGGYLFTEAGALKYKGSSGTVTTIAPA